MLLHFHLPPNCFHNSKVVLYSQFQRRGLDGLAPIALSRQPHLVHTMHNTHLYLARDVHDVECKKLARHPRERDVHRDLHLLACVACQHAIPSAISYPLIQPLPSFSLIDPPHFSSYFPSPVLLQEALPSPTSESQSRETYLFLCPPPAPGAPQLVYNLPIRPRPAKR
jgi:hypothetical protein